MFLTTASTPKIVKRRAVLATPHLPPTPPTTSFTMKSIIVLLVVWAVASAQGGTITENENYFQLPNGVRRGPRPESRNQTTPVSKHRDHVVKQLMGTTGDF